MSISSFIKRSAYVALLSSSFVLAVPAALAGSGEWYFYVQNNADSRLVKLQVSEDKRNWGGFNIGKGIAPGKTVKLTWDSSTNNEGCKQWIRAIFADGSSSKPVKEDFCENLDDPISFE